ncbi:PREDICTED: transcriptional repressor p66-alpha-like isoform X1 [Poecilia mexicana]|uniref:GATA-type domain-containing protein n=1 Tax=Poecilia mexicana TaxID=48701 RepID=A0A3B3X5H4_9TELE|nr:PREDICTED: transcriptional repressor p66-alpha isoform X1 [Poecilia formosa]XP_007570115.1 PREDICTED: transcriptional repressor p66-alpha-like isoform X1 [Poecilia formosa]XP_014823256.1 PREDICTED: transcriptional repressor p66-alpha isoform X1 [Poecilia mexicana]XP_014830563.1 PREDICTED: transcriptional repressor p66-alpha-like isoform X1 [Poecilia mexicana]
MSEEAVRQTRSQKRALERDHAALGGSPGDMDGKRVKLERGDAAGAPLALVGPAAEGMKLKSEQAAKVAASILKTGEVKATIKLEVQTGDEPVDMSTSKSDIKKEQQPPSPDDVIVLSDNEPSSPVMNGHCFTKTDTDKLMKSSPEERERIIKQLKEELRLQEAKLVLLKKLRQSQIQKESTVQKASGSVATPPPLVRGSMTSSKGPLQVTGRSSGTVIPPPLVRGGQHVPSKHNSQIVMPPLVRGAQQPIAVTPQQIASLRQHQQHSGSGPPPLLLAPRASVPNVQIQGQRIIQQGLIRVANVANNVMGSSGLKGSSPSSSVNDSPASRQAAAKLALRKQLEKTLLEIPPPKPPAPEFNFLPSAANNEFIYLLGLEEVVQKLLEMHGRGNLGPAASMASSNPKDPYTCAQCKTDFTSRWRKEKAGTILCDQCMSSNQKKALKAEHTNRLKAAFVKALQQEQEIEQRILQQTASSSSSKTTSSSSPSLSKSEVLISPQYKQIRSDLQHRSVSAHHSIKQSHLAHSIQSRGLAHSFTSSQLQNAVTAAALGSRAGKHAAALSLQQGAKVSASSSGNQGNMGAWRKQGSGNAGVTMAYVNPSLSAHKTSSAVERQREYLLDMIPSRSISQAANTWK